MPKKLVIEFADGTQQRHDFKDGDGGVGFLAHGRQVKRWFIETTGEMPTIWGHVDTPTLQRALAVCTAIHEAKWDARTTLLAIGKAIDDAEERGRGMAERERFPLINGPEVQAEIERLNGADWRCPGRPDGTPCSTPDARQECQGPRVGAQDLRMCTECRASLCGPCRWCGPGGKYEEKPPAAPPVDQ